MSTVDIRVRTHSCVLSQSLMLSMKRGLQQVMPLLLFFLISFVQNNVMHGIDILVDTLSSFIKLELPCAGLSKRGNIHLLTGT